MTERELPIGVAEFREVMGHFCTGVAVVTSLHNEEPSGMTCQSFVSVSLDPPLILFCPGATSTSWPKIREAGAFCVNVLARDQSMIAERFAKSGGAKFDGIDWERTELGSPALDGCLAHIECTIEQTHEAGDHDIVVARVQHLRLVQFGEPLLFFRGQFANLEF
jgi:3-hydroxy-9,10-secoandrosta-1,3,5(10)-triene-9,17-dione monooxygenase reductase component